MITERQRKSFRIARKLCDVSHRLPNEKDAAFFLRNCVRFERVMRGYSPFKNTLSGGVEKQETRWQSGIDTPEAERKRAGVATQPAALSRPTEQNIGNQIRPRQTSGSSAPPAQNFQSKPTTENNNANNNQDQTQLHSQKISQIT